MMKLIKTQCPWGKKTKKELWGFSFSFAPAVPISKPNKWAKIIQVGSFFIARGSSVKWLG